MPCLPSAPWTGPITTNEDLSRLHRAIVRLGRCTARVGPLSYAEATAWLGDDAAAVPTGRATLAERYALRAAAPVAAEPTVTIGGHL
ncbi:hypothetical protein [Micromonospora sp. NPDC005367]|uniref:hypothetical protein n=1 Tax=Micromonospora sp. NPDC005367 TaxID=3155590 RepID=UPI0033A885A4